MKKAELRQIYLSERKTISKQDRAEKSEAIAALFFKTFDLSTIKFIHTFIPIDKFNEVDTRLIISKLWHEFPSIETVVPRLDSQTNEMVSLRFAADTELVRNAWDIDEPAHDEVVLKKNIDLVLTPGLCFDKHGHRVGYGKGYYDRFLMKCRPDCLKVGLSLFDPIDQIDDVHEGDVRLDFIITADEVHVR